MPHDRLFSAVELQYPFLEEQKTRAVRMHVVIPEGRTVVLKVPDEVSVGPAELILLIEEQGTSDDSLGRFLDDLAERPRGRTRDSIQRQVRAERDAWS